MIVMPENQQAEACILAGVMIDTEGEALDVASSLMPEHFNLRSHGIIWESILDIHKSGKPINAITVCDHLKVRQKIQEVGGDYEVFKIAMAFASSAHTAYFVDVVKDKFRLRKTIELCSKYQHEAMKAQDSSEVIPLLESEILSLSESSADKDMNRIALAAQMFDEKIQTRLEKRNISGLMSGIKSLDDVTGGFQDSQFYIIGARPSEGKTALVDQTAAHLISNHEPFLYICLEGSDARVFGKIAAKKANISYFRFEHGYCTDEELVKMRRAKEFVEKSKMILVRPNDITGTEIRSLIRREKRRHGIKLVILDYLQKVTVPDKWEERRAIANASQQIQRACVETNVPALVLVQLNREAEKESRPRMRHLRDSGQIEQDADFIGLLHSECDKHDLQAGEMRPVLLSIEKNKDGASGIDQKMWFDGTLMRFLEKAT